MGCLLAGQTNVASSSPSSSPPPPPSTSQSTIQSTIESASPPSSSPSSNQNSSNSNNNNPSHTATVISQSSSAASTNVPSMSYYTVSGQLTSTFVTSTSSPSNLASPNLTDSIIGGAVGGATGALALTVLGIFFLCRRSRRKSNKSQISSVSDSEGNHDKTKMVVPPNIIIDAHSSTTRLYNPDDPSTFPRDPSTQVLDIGVQGSTYTSGRYMGIPEFYIIFHISEGAVVDLHTGIIAECNLTDDNSDNSGTSPITRPRHSEAGVFEIRRSFTISL
ncbi:hypothetical protein BJ138DRAFT_1116254 [Hygrophoropsis aurantiaca]|uniref:Uncharacterized protein n=1 Tax=Hygrophoropsis aurantiaca TaxID=72124 RepID=A0ACB8A450_9AGAM|nr:hypothetical protein BJ138DRAFT_1116254 [Hygrophoropsis aurantiaca]